MMAIALALATHAPNPQWICIDCTEECTQPLHAWVQATLIQREDGSAAWLVVSPEKDHEEPCTVATVVLG